MIALGERRELDFDLAVEAVGEVVKVTAEADPLISPDRMGSSQEIPEAEIRSLPTIRRQFQDFARTNRYVNVQPNDPTQTTISIAGKKNRFNSIVGSVSSIFSSAISNELILQYAKEDRPRAPNSTALPETVIGSNFQANFGQNNFLPNFLTEKRYQLIENFSYYLGNHTFRAGVDVSKVDYDDGFYRFGTGQYNFAGWADFFANRPSQFQQSFSATNGAVAYTTYFENAYVQDSWKPLPNLTIEAGIRYEFQDNPNSQDKNPLYPAIETIPDDKINWAPRLGFAWDLANDHRSVVRGGFGIFYTNTPSLLIATRS